MENQSKNIEMNSGILDLIKKKEALEKCSKISQKNEDKTNMTWD